jgi:hypothetical protein
MVCFCLRKLFYRVPTRWYVVIRLNIGIILFIIINEFGVSVQRFFRESTYSGFRLRVQRITRISEFIVRVQRFFRESTYSGFRLRVQRITRISEFIVRVQRFFRESTADLE